MGGRLPSLWHCGVAALVLGWPSQAAATDGSAIYGDLPPPPARAAIPGEQKLELELVINGLSAGFVAPVMLSGGRFRLRLADLKRAGVHIDAQGELLFLDEMPGVTANYDQRLQRLAIDVPASYLPAQRLGKKKRKFTPASYDVGALLNYDAYVSGGRGTSGQASLFHEARAFGAAGTLSTTGVVRSGPGKTYVRYDTRFRRSDEATATTIEVGDFITRSLPWASAVRLGGIQVSRDFGVRPDIITYPLPQFAGSAALPSTVELLVGNQRIAGGEVKPGPFALDTLPPINGAGEANLIVTDMNGRSIQTALPFYVSSNLLAPGLTDYAVAFGALRQNYGIKNFDYGSVAGSASLRPWPDKRHHARSSRRGCI
jgi:outer membrane usher protein